MTTRDDTSRSESDEAVLAFWKSALEDLPELNLPLDRPHSPIQSFVRSRETVVVPGMLATPGPSGAQVFELLCTAVAVLLFRYTGQSDLVVGSVSAADPETDGQTRIVPLRISFDGERPCSSLLARVTTIVTQAARHRNIDFEALLDGLGIEDDGVRAPLFQSMCILQGEPHSLSDNSVSEDDLFDIGDQLARVPLAFFGQRDGTSLIIDCDYDTDLLDAETVRRMGTHLATLLRAVEAKPDEVVSRIPMLAATERQSLLTQWNDTSVAFPPNETLVSLFEAQVRRSPDRVALVFEGRRVTYAELNRQANRLAHHLRGLGVGPDVPVGIFMERSVEMVTAIYGAIKAGGAYLPIDPEYPADRVAFMLDDAGPAVVLTQGRFRDRLEGAADVLVIDEQEEILSGEPESNPQPTAGPDDLAYVIYTSGSTGQPKGVMNAHRGIVNRLQWMQDAYRLDESDRVLQKTPFSFDVSVWEFFWPLQVGARLVVARPGGHRDNTYLVDTVRAHDVTTLHFVPSMLQLWLEEPGLAECRSLKRVICSGEALPYDLQQRFFERVGADLENLYGPTEAAVDVTFWHCERDSTLEIVPIGRPVANTQIYILDEYLEPVPIGVAGELHIGGAQVARGYLNRPELTAEKFIQDPFSDDPVGRLYKTGDLARYLPDGAIEYLGRIDNQVKLRGFRIELGEIEAALLAIEDVRESVVIVREDVPGDQRLVAYVVPRDRGPLDPEKLRRRLATRLPDFMVPASIVCLDRMPLSPNGKVERRALPAPATTRARPEAQQAVPGSEAEDVVSRIWQEVLQRDHVGLNDNFFDLGGHSLLVARCRSTLEEVFELDLTMTELFRFPTVASLADHIRERLGETPRTTTAPLRKAASTTAPRTTEIAIIGMACRLPGAADVEAFWANLEKGVESVRFFDDDELIEAGVPRAVVESENYVKARAILGDVDLFDAGFFGYSPREAQLLDPQQRIFLECAWEALERSGYDPGSTELPVGVFAGSGMNTYVLNYLQPAAGELSATAEFQRMIANDKDFLATRVAYKLNLTGPAIVVQTACSTSLVAVHMACQSLLDGECEMALAGGVSVSLPERAGYHYQEGMILSADGHCRPFDAAATGTVFGNGAAIVVLKPLEQAVDDGDHIHAVIKGSAINNDGSLKIGYTAPSVEGQASVITRAQSVAGVDPRSIGYVETHGTGTALGDPIEVEALVQAFRQHTDDIGFCGIGSVKSNIGHVDAAAGATGLIKAALALEKKRLPPSLHFETPNPQIDFESSPFYVVDEARDWPRADTPHRAGVSSFGIGGTNAHVVLEEAPAAKALEATTPERSHQLLCLSARSEEALVALADRYATYLSRDAEVPLADAGFTTNAGRAAMPHRLAVVGESARELGATLRRYVAREAPPGLIRGSVADGASPSVAFLFTGQGSQWVGMGRELYGAQPVFRQELERCQALLLEHLELPLLEVMFSSDLEDPLLHETQYTQPALFAVEWSLAQLWRSWGIAPSVLLGHSVGEYVAACEAGVFSVEDGLRLIAARGRLMQALPRNGSMVAVLCDEERVVEALTGYEQDVSLAAVNGPTSLVVSGRTEAVEAALAPLRASGVQTRELVVSHAFHSPMMEPMLDDFEAVADEIRMAPPRLPVVSNVTGELAGPELATANYWRRHVRSPVRFASGMETLRRQEVDVFLEAGPAPVLIGMGRQCVPEESGAWLASLRRSRPAWQQMLTSLAELYVRGQHVDWSGYERGHRRRRVPLPTYPFQRERFWIDPPPTGVEAAIEGHPLVGRRLRLPGSREVRFETRFSEASPPYVPDHRVFGVLVVAGASHVSMFLQAAIELFGERSLELRELFFLQPFVLEEDETRTAQLVFTPDGPDLSFELMSLPDGADPYDSDSWVVHATGRLEQDSTALEIERSGIDLATIQNRCTEATEGTEFYESFWVQGPDAGPSFRWIETLWKGDGEALAVTRCPALDDDVESYRLHPGLIEACFQTMRGAKAFESQELLAAGGDLYVPFGIGAVRFFGGARKRLWCHARMRETVGEDSYAADLRLFDESGELVAEIDDFEVRRLPRANLLRSLRQHTDDWLYDLRWEERPLPSEQENGDGGADGAWLLLADEHELGGVVATELEARGGTVLLAGAADAYSNEGRVWTIDPTEPDHYERLLADAAKRAGLPVRGVLHAWGTSPAGASADATGVMRDQIKGGESVLLLVQALLRSHESPPRLVLSTRGVQAAGLAEPPTISHAPMWGLARVITLESPELDCRCVDLDLTGDGGEGRAVAGELIAKDTEEMVAHRGGRRLVARLAPAKRRVDRDAALTIQPEASYLITGGMRGLGLEAARWLAEQGARHLVLVGRRPPSDDARETLDGLEASGVQVLKARADVANADDVARVFEQIGRDLPPLRGVIHAAGALDDGVVLQQTPERFRTVMAPKVAGTLYLDEQTRDLSLDFFVCFSSATSVLGASGQSNYSAANAFLDAFAHHRASRGLAATAINWGPWADVGMAARLDERDRLRQQRMGWDSIPLDAGFAILDRLLASKAVQVAVLPIRWGKYARSVPGASHSPLLANVLPRQTAADSPAATVPSRTAADDLLECLPENREPLLTTYVTDEVVSLLGLSDVTSLDPQTGFADLGMDSLMSIEFRSRLQKGLGIKLSATFAFDYPNIEAVTDYLMGTLFERDEGASEEPRSPVSSDRPTVPAELPAPEAVDASVDEAVDDLIEEELLKLEAQLDKDPSRDGDG